MLAAGGARKALCAHCGLPCSGAPSGPEPLFCCLGCSVAHRFVLAGDREGGASTEPLRLGLGIFFTLNVMVASWVSHSRDLFGSGLGLEQDAVVELSTTIAMFLATVVVALLGMPLLGGVLASLSSMRRGRLSELQALSAQTLIVIGVFSAYVLSVVRWARGEEHLYFDTAAILLVVVTLGGVVEAAARRRATESALRVLSDLPARVQVLRGGAWVDVERSELVRGDRVEVRVGETVPVDGHVVEGSSRIDEASFTGEASSRAVKAGDQVLAGSQNLEGVLRVDVDEVGEDTVLAQMEEALADARSVRPAVQRLADRVAALAVPAVVLLALALFASLALRGAAADGMIRALTVLLISCPCALGLAAPLATWSGLRRAAEVGILVDSSETLERAALMGTVFFDKTGTLTEPGFDLERIFVAPGVDRDWAISAAVALERASRHPVARALVAAFEGERLEPLRVSGVREEAGFGIEGGVGARRLFLGSVRWARDLGAEIGPDLGSGSTDGSEIVLMDDERVLAAFRLQERLREGAANALETLRMSGVEVAVLSGDSRERVDAVVARLRLPGFSRLLPLDKVDHLVRARSEGRPVAMVGDGVNDSLVLAAADVGISIGSASDLAARSGNVRLTTDRLDRIPLLFEIARDVRRRIAINLGFAFGFNTIGIALAATGRLTPVIAALAMVFSSVAVVRISSNAGRLAAPVSPPARGRDSVSAGHWEPAKEVAS